MPSEQPASEPRTTWRHLLLFGLGILLLVAAVGAVVLQQDRLRTALEAAGSAPMVLVVCLLLLPLANWVLTSGAVWVLTARYGPVRPLEMLPLIGSAWLLNHLPMRVGMVGRVAYHKRFHGIRVQDCLKALLLNVVATGVALVVLFLAVIPASRIPTWAGVSMVLLPSVALAMLSALLRWRRPRTEWLRLPALADFADGELWRLAAALLFRYLDVLVWAVRYWLVFSMLGTEVSWLAAVGVTGAAQAAMFTPVQFGLREWVVGLASAALPMVAVSSGAAPTAGGLLEATAPGLMTDVVMRASELAVVVPVGLVSTWVVWRMARKRPSESNNSPTGGL